MSLKKRLFLQKNDRGTFVKTLSKIEEGLDFEILVFKVSLTKSALKQNRKSTLDKNIIKHNLDIIC